MRVWLLYECGMYDERDLVVHVTCSEARAKEWDGKRFQYAEEKELEDAG